MPPMASDDVFYHHLSALRGEYERVRSESRGAARDSQESPPTAPAPPLPRVALCQTSSDVDLPPPRQPGLDSRGGSTRSDSNPRTSRPLKGSKPLTSSQQGTATSSVEPAGYRRTSQEIDRKSTKKQGGWMECPKGHRLYARITRGGSCRECRSAVPAETVVMHCEECQWWICHDCNVDFGEHARRNMELTISPIWEAHSSGSEEDKVFWYKMNLKTLPQFTNDRRHSSHLNSANDAFAFLADPVGHLARARSANWSSLQARLESVAKMSSGQDLLRMMLLAPSSIPRLVFDMMALLAFVLELWIVPLKMFFIFGDGSSPAIDLCLWICLIYWSTSIPISFFYTNYTATGELLAGAQPFLQYFKTWFLFDLVLVVLGWIDMLSSDEAAGNNSSTPSLSSTASTARAFRMFRLLRVIRVKDMMDNAAERKKFSGGEVVITLVTYSVAMLSLIHMIACGWYAVALMDRTTGKNWIEVNDMGATSWGYQYFTSMHWALGQFSPTKLKEVPTNLAERIYAMSTGCVAIIVNPLLVGKVTTEMVSLQSMRTKKLRQRGQLRRYLDKNDVTGSLRRRIFSFLHGTHAQEHLAWSDVSLLQSLPADIHSALKLEIVRPIFRWHPFFKYVEVLLNRMVVKTLCTDVIEDCHVDLGKRIFAMGELAKHMTIVVTGELQYCGFINQESLTLRTQTMGSDIPARDVPPGSWLSEQALWFENWFHRGVALANWNSELLRVSAAGFQQLLKSSPLARYHAQCFCALCLDELGSWNLAFQVVNQALLGPPNCRVSVANANTGTHEESVSPQIFDSETPPSSRSPTELWRSVGMSSRPTNVSGLGVKIEQSVQDLARKMEKMALRKGRHDKERHDEEGSEERGTDVPKLRRHVSWEDSQPAEALAYSTSPCDGVYGKVLSQAEV